VKRLAASLGAILFCAACGAPATASATGDGGADAAAADAGSAADSLDGMRIELPCTKDDSSTTCEASMPADVRRAMGGDPGALYQVRLRVRGVVEEKTLRGGTVASGSDTLLASGGDLGNDTYDVYTVDIDSPPQTLYLNRGTSGLDYSLPLDYEVTVTIAGGAHVTLSADPVDTAQIKNLDATALPIVVPDVPPYPSAFDGQFAQIDVLGAVALPPTTASPARVDALVFDGQDARRTTSTKDWAPSVVKNECGTTQALTGLSADKTTKLEHAALCTPDVPDHFARGACRDVSFDSSGAAACGATEFVAGIAVTKGLPQSVLCCAGLPEPASACAPLALGTVDAREPGTTSGDWDPNEVKLECGPSRFVARVTRATSGGALATITCCQ